MKNKHKIRHKNGRWTKLDFKTYLIDSCSDSISDFEYYTDMDCEINDTPISGYLGGFVNSEDIYDIFDDEYDDLFDDDF